MVEMTYKRRVVLWRRNVPRAANYRMHLKRSSQPGLCHVPRAD